MSTSTKVKSPAIFKNRQNYPVVVPSDRNGSSVTVRPGEYIVGQRFEKCVSKKGLTAVPDPKPTDYVGAIDPMGLAREYLEHIGSQNTSTRSNDHSDEAAQTYAGRTRDEWIQSIIMRKPESIATEVKAAEIKEIAEFIGVSVEGQNKLAMAKSLRERVEELP